MEKVTVITGASKGIGRELAQLALKDNHKVIAIARTKEKLDELKAQSPNNVIVVTGDLNSQATREEIVSTAESLGRIDYLVNNAGYGPVGLFEKETVENMEQMISLNVVALIDLTRRCLPLLKKSDSGRILNISSIAGLNDFPLIATYTATKHAVVGFSRALNTELAMTNVYCTAYCPAGVATEFFDSSMKKEAVTHLSKFMETGPKVAKAIWKKRDARKHTVIPTFRAYIQYFFTRYFDFIMRPLTRLYMKKHGQSTVEALIK